MSKPAGILRSVFDTRGVKGRENVENMDYEELSAHTGLSIESLKDAEAYAEITHLLATEVLPTDFNEVPHKFYLTGLDYIAKISKIPYLSAENKKNLVEYWDGLVNGWIKARDTHRKGKGESFGMTSEEKNKLTELKKKAIKDLSASV